jgi:hypothetical protein
VTAATVSGWPDIFVGIGIFLMNLDAHERPSPLLGKSKLMRKPRPSSELERRLVAGKENGVIDPLRAFAADGI